MSLQRHKRRITVSAPSPRRQTADSLTKTLKGPCEIAFPNRKLQDKRLRQFSIRKPGWVGHGIDLTLKPADDDLLHACTFGSSKFSGLGKPRRIKDLQQARKTPGSAIVRRG